MCQTSIRWSLWQSLHMVIIGSYAQKVLHLKPHIQHVRWRYRSVLLIFHFVVYKGFVSILCSMMVFQAIDILLGPSSTWTVFPLSSKVFLIIAIAIFLQSSNWGSCGWDLAHDHKHLNSLLTRPRRKNIVTLTTISSSMCQQYQWDHDMGWVRLWVLECHALAPYHGKSDDPPLHSLSHDLTWFLQHISPPFSNG